MRAIQPVSCGLTVQAGFSLFERKGPREAEPTGDDDAKSKAKSHEQIQQVRSLSKCSLPRWFTPACCWVCPLIQLKEFRKEHKIHVLGVRCLPHLSLPCESCSQCACCCSTGSDVPSPMDQFDELASVYGVPPYIVKNLTTEKPQGCGYTGAVSCSP